MNNFRDKLLGSICLLAVSSNDRLVEEQHAVLARIMPGVWLLIAVFMLVLLPTKLIETDNVILLVALLATAFFCLSRGYYWWFYQEKFKQFSLAQKKKDVGRLFILTPLLTLFFTGIWGYQLSQVSNFEDGLLTFILFVCAVAVSASLFVVPLAAISCLWLAVIPFALGLSFNDAPHLDNVILLMVVFSVFLSILIVSNFRAFVKGVQGLVKIEQEQRDRLRTHEALERVAFIDPLTELPNKRRFVRLLQTRAQTAHDTGQAPGAVFVARFENFRDIASVYGSDSADAVLRLAADRLRDLCGENDIVATASRGQFLVYCEDIDGSRVAFEFGLEIRRNLQRIYEVGEDQITVSASQGICLCREREGDIEKLLARAKLAMEAKRKFRPGGIGMFKPELEFNHLRVARLEQALKPAIANGEIELWYQPVVAIADGHIRGFEALARWQNSELGHVSPAEFIEIAEKSELIIELTLCLLNQAIGVAKKWPQDVRLFFNLSAKVLARPQACEKIRMLIAQSGLSAQRFDLEITETAIIHHAGQVRDEIQKFRDLGCGIALDDFGTGHSSLEKICELPIDKIKIDKSFIDNVAREDRMQKLVATMITMAKSLQLECVVEGVETLEQLGVLSDIGASLGQGYLFSKPVPAERTIRRVRLINAA